MISKKSFIIFLFVIAFLFGCSAEKEIETTERVIPASRLLRKMEGNRRKVKTFQGTGTINVRSEKFSGKTSFEIFVKKPDSIKISIYGPFGIDVAHGLFTGNKFIFYDVLRNRVFTGEESKDVLQKLFKVNLSFEELLDSFTGAVNLTSKLLTEPTDYEILDDIYNLTYTDTTSNKKSTYRVSKDDLRITEYLVTTLDGKEMLYGEYSKFKDYDGVPIPSTLLIRNKNEKQSVFVEYKKIFVNRKIESLTIDLPTDIEIIKW
jgi:outer membrane lipoprotein-sorting protein